MWWSKGHGRIECRELWVVDSRELTQYLHQEWRWPGVQLAGRIRRSRKRRHLASWETQETWTWVGSSSPTQRTPRSLAQDLRGHWAVENGVFRVRDVSYDEDRLHGRKIAHSLSIVRNLAITIIRREGYPYIPDGCRDIATHSDHGLHLLTQH